MDFHKTSQIYLPCSKGLPPYLGRELAECGFRVRRSMPTGVETEGSLLDAMRLNLRLRTAQCVLYLLSEFRCTSPDHLYAAVRAIPWEGIVPADGYLTVDSRVDTPSVNNSMFPNLKVKDAVVDRIAEKVGRRPDSGPRRDGAVVHLFWRGEECRVFLDTSGRKLSDRGYRRIPHKAPLRETLAAGVVMATGYDGSRPLVAPMCGSGTLAIEAALLAAGRAPGLLRSCFAFQRLVGFDGGVWQRVRAEARGKPRPVAPIVATDIDRAAVEAARRNAAAAGVDRMIQFRACDFAETPVPSGPGVLVMNPEYGERMGEGGRLEATYKRIGDFLKQRCAGYSAFVLTGNPDLAKRIGLRPKRRIPLHNARIECRLMEYEMYEGSRRG